jgi:hypothetical protein
MQLSQSDVIMVRCVIECLGVRMGKIEEYRSYAARALQIAENSESPRNKALLLTIAQGWLDLAAAQMRPFAWPRDPDQPSENQMRPSIARLPLYL